MREIQEAARAIGRQLPILKASSEGDIDLAFGTLAQLHAEALVVAADPFFYFRHHQVVALAAHHAIPAIYEFREFVAAGGLMSYGVSLIDTWRQIGGYVGRILAGAKPADLPIQRPTRFELVINLKTAKTLGLENPAIHGRPRRRGD